MTLSPAPRLASFALFLFVAASTHSNSAEWLRTAIKKDNPEELGYRVFVELNCPVGQEEVEQVVEQLFIRNGLITSPYAFLEKHLQISISCFMQDKAQRIFSQEIYFSPPRDTGRPDLVYDWNFGRYGIGGREFILKSVTRSIEDAIAEYLSANFS